MRLTRILRMGRWAPVAAVLVAGACSHGDVNSVISLDGDTIILNISMSTQNAGGVPTGTRAVNRFLATAFDTSFADAFSRSSTNPVNYFRELTCGYGTGPMILPTGAGTPATYQSPNVYLPAMPYRITIVDGCGGGQATDYIVPKGHAGNGAGNVVWEFWFHFTGAPSLSTRYVMGLARYALQQRGALDISERLLTGAVTTPDTLVFRTGDFNPGGKITKDAFTTSCANAGVVHPVAGANPHFLAGDTSLASGEIDLDQTACAAAGEAWSDLGTATSPVPSNNNTALGANQYNFFVIWEALPDSTPDYTKPVFRAQIGPLISTAGVVINNGYGPIPEAALTPAQQALLTGATSRPDTVTITVNNLPALSGAAYQIWFTKTGTDSVSRATGLFEKLVNNVVVTTTPGATEFNGDTLAATYRLTIDFGTYSTLAGFNSAVLAIAPTGASATTLPAAQPMWTGLSNKLAGQPAPSLGSNLLFGNFDNGGAARATWAPAGAGSGGVFGRTLDVQVFHLLRPPVGMYYNAYLRNSSTGAVMDLGAITGPFPDYSTLLDADVNATGSVNAIEIVQAALRVEAASGTDLCAFDKVDVRLEPKARVSGAFTLVQETSRIISISGNSPYPSLPRCTTP